MIDAAVVDASVGIKLFIEEPGSVEAEWLFSGLAASPPARFYIPDVFYIECANTLWKYVRRYGYSAENASSDIAALQALDLFTVSTADLLLLALELALEHDLSAYDACYAALAQELDLPLITADTNLARKLARSEIEVVLLKDL